MLNVSVIICTRNPRKEYLQRVLKALKAQTLSRDQWELLVVDNASEQRLSETWDITWHPGARHVREEVPGLAPARLRGIRESCGDLLIFVDDDNVLAETFLETAKQLAANHAHLGVFGAGVLEPEFELQPPAELRPYLRMLALRRVERVRWSNNTNDNDTIPWGAGLCVTRRVAKRYLHLIEELNISQLLGRREQHLFSGDDDLFAWASVEIGQGFGLFPQLRVMHLISSVRLTQRYFLRLKRDHSFSHGILAHLLAGVQYERTRPLRYVRIAMHAMRNGLFSARCQLAEVHGKERARRFISENHPRVMGASARGQL